MVEKKIAIVGEAWGEKEELLRMPFIGPAGYELNTQLEDAGINRSECFITNTFNLRPQNNDIKTLCHSKKEDTLGRPPLASGSYLRPEYAGELVRLYSEITEIQPNIVIALGGTALWALTGLSGISKLRGALRHASFLTGEIRGHKSLVKVLPTYHPAAVLRQYNLRPIAVADLMKAARQSEFPEIRMPRREIWLEPTLQDIETFHAQHILPAKLLSVDIETAKDQITCIGFAPSPYRSLVVPFWDRRGSGSYWPSLHDEYEAWRLVRSILCSHVPKLFQNGLYDIHWLWKQCGIPVKNALHDTMLLSHALHPEAQKGLGFLGSIYADAPAWKTERARGVKSAKKEDE